MRDPAKGLSSLRKGRRSGCDCVYFLTICLKQGSFDLDTSFALDACLKVLKDPENVGVAETHGFVLMPDHAHLLISLQNGNQLQDMVRVFKGRMSPVLRKLGLGWQRGYYDRLLRESDSVGIVLRYMQMNPYRKSLVKTDEHWPYWFCSEKARVWMDNDLENDVPLPEWLGK
jgi:putative transposase|tara:strand:- start:38 stop:553 length:516 start_codon:yes stop_codon:yes gene_type:complete